MGVSVSGNGASVGQAAAPVELPKGIKWDKPRTLVEAKPAAQIMGGGQKAVVTYVSDGDTANLKAGDRNFTCRIDSIDAPETAHPKQNKPGQPYGEDAAAALRRMVESKEVTVRITKPSVNGSNYGRDVCQIEISGKNVSHEMVKAGAAWVYQQFASDPTLFAAQQEAQANKRGLWGMPGTPVYPPTFRQSMRPDTR